MNKFLVGLIIGIAIAGGVAFYLNNAPMQITEKNVSNKSDSNVIGASGPITLVPGTKLQEEVPGSAKPTASTTSYDFYDVLQGKPASKNSSDTEAKKAEQIFVQAGAFEDEDAANDIKAKIALLGFDSRIKAEHSGDKIINKVIIGPLPNEDEAKQVLQQLSNEEINATLVKISN